MNGATPTRPRTVPYQSTLLVEVADWRCVPKASATAAEEFTVSCTSEA